MSRRSRVGGNRRTTGAIKIVRGKTPSCPRFPTRTAVATKWERAEGGVHTKGVSTSVPQTPGAAGLGVDILVLQSGLVPS